MLLHMVIATCPIDDSVDRERNWYALGSFSQQMVNLSIFPNYNINHGPIVKRAQVMRLPARGGVEVALIQQQG